MKKLYLFAALAAMLAACSENDLAKQSPQNQETAEQGAVTFEAYTQRPVTRAGQTGVLKIENLKEAVNLTDQNGGGFGVFGYYTDNSFYMPTRMPDFMYNQLVEWKDSKWQYSPVKYWPNEYGDNAISDDNDRVSFFAYAPYVATSNSGKVDKPNDTWGIVGMSRNSAVGDPLVKFVASFEKDKSVDLLWGVCDDVNWQLVNTGSIQQTINDGKAGLPWKDVQRPQGLDQKMKFTFKHALTQLSVFVDAVVDEYTTTDKELAANTKIYVRSISFTGVTLKGTLNLNNVEANKALWLDYNGLSELTSSEPVTVYDGLKDGKEGIVGNIAVSEKILGLNPDIISNVGNTNKGVVAATEANGGKSQPLFANTPVMLIPTGEDMEVEIVYDVETEDPMLATFLSDGKKTGSSIENRIKKTVSFGDKGLENGKNYTLNLHLGLNSVKFDAAVSEWQESHEVREADLPANMPAFTAQAGTVAPSVVEIAGYKQDYIFAVTGLTPGETVTASIVGTADDAIKGKGLAVSSNPSTLDAADGKANASGIAYVRVKDVENKTVRNLAAQNTLQVQGGKSQLLVKLQFNQKASPYQLQINTVAAGTSNDEITLASLNSAVSSTTNIWKAGDDYDNGWATGKTGDVITVLKNGEKLVLDDVVATGKYTWDETDKKITVNGHLVPGDIIEITFNNGEAPEETVVAKIGGLSFVPSTRVITYRATPYVYPEKMPALFGDPGNITWAIGASGTDTSNDNVSVATDGKITTKKASASETIRAESSATNTAGGEWFYTDETKKATYSLTINKQATVTTFATPAPADILINKAANTPIINNPATAVGIEGDALTGATYAYTVEKVNNADTDKDKFTFAGSTLTVAGSALPENTEYIIEVKAATTLSTGDADNFTTSNATYTIKVKTGN